MIYIDWGNNFSVSFPRFVGFILVKRMICNQGISHNEWDVDVRGRIQDIMKEQELLGYQ
jgi:hypothetical protein